MPCDFLNISRQPVAQMDSLSLQECACLTFFVKCTLRRTGNGDYSSFSCLRHSRLLLNLEAGDVVVRLLRVTEQVQKGARSFLALGLTQELLLVPRR